MHVTTVLSVTRDSVILSDLQSLVCRCFPIILCMRVFLCMSDACFSSLCLWRHSSIYTYYETQAHSNSAAPVGERSIAIGLSVCESACVCVCLSVREHACETAGPIFTKFLRRCPLAVARSSSGGVAIPGWSLMSMNALFAFVLDLYFGCQLFMSAC